MAKKENKVDEKTLKKQAKEKAKEAKKREKEAEKEAEKREKEAEKKAKEEKKRLEREEEELEEEETPKKSKKDKKSEELELVGKQTVYLNHEIGAFMKLDYEEETILFKLSGHKKFELNFKDIINFEFQTRRVERNVQNQSRKGAAGAAIGMGLLFGAAGAIAGTLMANKKQTSQTEIVDVVTLIITTNSLKNSTFECDLESDQVARNVDVILSNVVGEDKKIVKKGKANTADIDELLKYKQLLDQGIITQKEFDQKKKELLKL